MSKEMDELRAAMMKRHVFNWWQRRELRWLSPKHEDQRKIVIAALGQDHELMPRMMRCGEISASNNMFYCGIPLCPRCFMRERGRQTKQSIRETFVGAKNEELAFVTVLLPARSDIADAHDVIKKEKLRLRNFILRQRGVDNRWNDFQLVGFWEMGRTTIGEFQNAGRKTTLALKNLEFPVVGPDDETVWLPHLHAIVRKGQLTDKEIAKALRNDGHHAPYQVDVRPFHTYRPVEHNIQNLTRYSLKFRIENDYKQLDAFDFIASDKEDSQTRDWWPAKDIKAYAEWLRVERSGFQSLRFVLGSADEVVKPNIAVDLKELDERESIATCGPSLNRNDDEEIAVKSNEKSTKPCADGICYVEVDGLFDAGVRVGYESDGVRYNNVLLDTNWIGGCASTEADAMFPKPDKGDDDAAKSQLSPFLTEYVKKWQARQAGNNGAIGPRPL
jgi:hypothetical protein